MKFFDRKAEKIFLEDVSKKKGKRMIVIYGRRRIGKTTLLRNLFPDASYFFVDTRSSETLLGDFSRQIFDGRFENWESFFRFLLKNNKIIIMDEFQNFGRIDRSIFSALQKVWDELDSSPLLILCGSYVGMMKKIFLNSKEPLFGRSDYPVQLKSFRFTDTFEMLAEFGYSLEEIIIWYSILGGVPKYLWYLEETKDLNEKLKELFFSDFAPLREEGKNLLVGEFGTEHLGYFALLEAIGANSKEAGEIIDRTGMVRTKAMKYLNELTNNYDIVEKTENFLSKSKRGARYRIKDNFQSFWFRYIYSNQNMVEFNPEAALNFTMDNLQSRIGFVFEDIVNSLLPLLYKEGLLPAIPVKTGNHWGKVPGAKGKIYEIDILAECANELLVIECKWTNQPVDQKIIDNLKEKAEYIDSEKIKIPVIVSKNGFKKNTSNDVIKINLNDIEVILKKQLS